MIESSSSARENQMGALATMFLILGIFTIIACLSYSGIVTKESRYDDWGEQGMSFVWILIGVAGLVQGAALYIVLQAGAEVIKLLRMLNYRSDMGAGTITNSSRNLAEREEQANVPLSPSGALSKGGLHVLMEKNELLSKMTTDEVFGKDRTWSFITENGLSEFVPHVLRLVGTAWAADDQFFYHGMETTVLSGMVSDYLTVVPRDVVVNHLNDLLLDKEKLSGVVFTQINRLNLLDLECANRMLDSDQSRVRKRALRVLKNRKPNYEESDIQLLKSIIEKLASAFKPTGRVVETSKKLFTGIRQVWICEDGHTSDINRQYCYGTKCGKDIHGFYESDTRPEVILPGLKMQLDALNNFYSSKDERS